MTALHAIETAPDAVWQAEVDAKLSALIALAAEASPFHADRLRGLTLTGRADLAQVPILDKDAWTAAGPPYATASLTRPLAGAYVFRTGGSSGEPKFSAFAVDEFKAFVTYFERSYYAAGLRSTDSVANMFACGGLYASFIFVNRLLEEMGCLNFPFTTAAAPETVAAQVKSFGINTLLGFPSWLMQVAEVLVAQGLTVEKVFYAGEHLYDEERAYLRDRLGATTIASAGYGAVDSGLMGYQCDAAEGGVHHVLVEHAHLEIVDPETHQPVPAGEPGLIVVTNLDRTLQPVIRYLAGDMGRWIEGTCPCGRTSPRFELLHRGDDALRFGYANLTYREVVGAFSGFPDITSTIQMVKEREAGKDRLLFKIEVREAVAEAALVDRLNFALGLAKPDLAKLIENGSLHPVRYEFLPVGAIPRLPVTGKFKRTVDLSR